MTGCEIYRPERTQAFRILSGAVIAPLPDWYSSLLIIHGDPRPHPRYHYARMRAAALSDPDSSPYTVISPDQPPQPQEFDADVSLSGTVEACLDRYNPATACFALENALSADFPEPLIIIPA